MKRLMPLCLAGMVLGGCGVPMSETQGRPRGNYISAEDRVLGQDPIQTAMQSWSRVPAAYREGFGAPRAIPAREGATPLPADTVVHVELTQHPRSCVAGEVALTEDIWVLVAQPRSTPAGFSMGPEWLGDWLRIAGAGGTLEIPEPAPCDPRSDGLFEGVPKRVFAQAGHTVRLHTGRAISARVIEACPAAPSVESYTVSSYQVPMFFYRNVPMHLERERTTMRVRARCGARNVSFAYGPLTSRSPLDPRHDPRPDVTSSVDPGR